jgi:hypothetical protein
MHGHMNVIKESKKIKVVVFGGWKTFVFKYLLGAVHQVGRIKEGIESLLYTSNS